MKMRWLFYVGLLLLVLPAQAAPEFTDAEAKRFFDRGIRPWSIETSHHLPQDVPQESISGI
jgi:hypothetical protein